MSTSPGGRSHLPKTVKNNGEETRNRNNLNCIFVMDGPTLIAPGAACLTNGGLLRSTMDHRVVPRVASPIGFEATMSVAMELENELKHGLPVPSHVENGKTTPKIEPECRPSEDGSPTRDMEELMEEEEELDEEDADSLCRSTGSFDGDLSPSVDNSKEEIADDEEVDPFRKLHSAIERNNGNGRPDSSEGDYYDVSQSPPPALYNRPRDNDGEGGTDEYRQCPYKFQSNAEYDHKCSHCDYTSRTEGRLKRHVKDFHAELPADDFSPSGTLKSDPNGGGTPQSKVKTYRCKQCSYVATVKTDFWDHSKSHIKAEKLLTCPKCPFVTEYKHHLEYHLRNHFGSKPFKCPKCIYSCVNKSMLNSHMKSHSNIYQYRCANCTYATKYCHSLKLHLRKYGHTPSTVLNADGTPNPVPVIDVYGTRRGPRTKKSQDELYTNAGSNGGNGTLPFSPLQMSGGNGAISPSAVLPFFYQGTPAGLPNGFHPNGNPRNGNHSPTSGILGSSGEGDEVDSRRHHSPGDPGPFKCSLCDFSTEHRDAFSKHMLLHAAADNQDLCNLYGISSDSLLQDPSQQQHSQMETATMVAAALGLPQQQQHRADILMRHHTFNLLQVQGGQEHNQNFGFHKGPNQAQPKVPPKPSAADEPPGRSPPNPLEHLRAFSEQVNIKPFMMKEFSSNLFAAAPPTVSPLSDNQQTSPALNGSGNKVSPARHPPNPPKISKHGAIRGDRPMHASVDNHASLGPLDLSSTKGGPRPPGLMTFPYHLSPQQQQFHFAAQQMQQRYPLSPAYLLQHQHQQQQLHHHQQQQQQQKIISQGALEICTTEPTPAEASISPNPTKNRRKGKAFKLDRICMKLHKERESPPVGQLGLTDDSMEDGDVSKNSEDATGKSSTPNNDSGFETNDKPKFSPSGEVDESAIKSPVDIDKKSDDDVPVEQVLVESVLVKVEVKNKDQWSEAYKCQYCDMAFKDCVMYTVHMGYHGFKDPFKCNMCGHQAKDKVAFFLHMARMAHL